MIVASTSINLAKVVVTTYVTDLVPKHGYKRLEVITRQTPWLLCIYFYYVYIVVRIEYSHQYLVLFSTPALCFHFTNPVPS